MKLARANVKEQIVRDYVRSQMNERNLEKIFKIIQEEYTKVYYEDNVFTRQDYLHELVDKTVPEKYTAIVNKETIDGK